MGQISYIGKKLYVCEILEGISKDMGYLEGKRLSWIFLKRRIIKQEWWKYNEFISSQGGPKEVKRIHGN